MSVHTDRHRQAKEARWGNGPGKEGEIMKALVTRVRNFIRSEDGPTATEYAVMLALIIIVAMAGITLLGTQVNTIFTNVSNGLPTGS